MMLALRELRVLPSLCRGFHCTEHHKRKKLPDPWDLMTGKELFEAVQYARGNIDPFFTLPVKRGPGTKDCPNIVPSVYDKRVVGCLCEPDATRIVYWWLHEGYPRRCNCNYWFVLERIDIPPLYEN